jgi:hypothetical protein
LGRIRKRGRRKENDGETMMKYIVSMYGGGTKFTESC